MRLISLERIGEYISTCIHLLAENNGQMSASELIKKMEEKLQLVDVETKLMADGYNTRWETQFRLHSIGLVHGGYLARKGGVWTLTEKGRTLLEKDNLELFWISNNAYNSKKKAEEGEEPDAEDVPPPPIETPPLSSLKIEVDKLEFYELIKKVEKSLIQIPPFQRTFVWSARDITGLLNSIYWNYPIGSLIFWKTSQSLPHHRSIGGITLKPLPPLTPVDYVLDGQQRITSLFTAIRSGLLPDAKYVFFFDVAAGKFDYESADEVENYEQTGKIPLQNLFVDEGNLFEYLEALPPEYKKIVYDLQSRFKKYMFSVITVYHEHVQMGESAREEDLEEVVKIFSTINETGKKLTVVAKMVARCWGGKFDLRGHLDELFGQRPELADLSEETVLMLISAVHNKGKCKEKNILSTPIRDIENTWDDIVKALHSAVDFIHGKIGIPHMRYLPYDALVIPIAYYFYLHKNVTAEVSARLVQWFWFASIARRYSGNSQTKLEEDATRLASLAQDSTQQIKYPMDWPSVREELLEENYFFRNALIKTILSLYTTMRPQNFSDGSYVDLIHGFSDYSKQNLHHIFPRAYIANHQPELKKYSDSIVNITLIPANTNREISANPPSEYFAKYRTENIEFKNILNSHLIHNIKGFGIDDNNFELFLERRADAIIEMLQYKSGIISSTEFKVKYDPNTPIDSLEQQLRDLITRTLQVRFDSNQIKQQIPPDVMETMKKRAMDHLKSHPFDIEKYTNTLARIDFLDIMDYHKIIERNWDLFESRFGSQAELLKHFLALKNFRNIVKHNREDQPVEQKNGEAALLWFEKVLV